MAFGSGRSVPVKSRTMVLLTPNNSLDRSAGSVFLSPVVVKYVITLLRTADRNMWWSLKQPDKQEAPRTIG